MIKNEFPSHDKMQEVEAIFQEIDNKQQLGR